ncbi:TPA: glycosyltransferase [Photobacterium damselae]
MKIFFVKNKNAFLPEVNAYLSFFKHNNIESEIVDNGDIASDGDVVWYFMGVNLKRKKYTYVIHEYASLSVGMLPKLKNKIKKIINCKPDLRVFLNENIRDELNFNDNIPYIIRDMAVSEEFKDLKKKKIYDYVYCGRIDNDRKLDLILEQFKQRTDKSILVIGNVPNSYIKRFSGLNNITFVGCLPNSKVPFYLNQAKIGINIINNTYPYSIQTSTKILEYLACGLSIYSTRTSWCENFEKKNNLKFTYFDCDKIDFNASFEFDYNYQPKYWSELLNDINIVSKIKGISNE